MADTTERRIVFGPGQTEVGERVIIRNHVERVQVAFGPLCGAGDPTSTRRVFADVYGDLIDDLGSLSADASTCEILQSSRLLGPGDIADAAGSLGVEPAVVRAFDEVESRGRGFLPGSGRPKILFEAAAFHKQTGGRYDAALPSVSAATWKAARAQYVGGESEWQRFTLASSVDFKAAVESASWGRYQIMGANYKACGHADQHSFFVDMLVSERKHLDALVNFVKSDPKLHAAMKSLDWKVMAARYNGPGYAKNSYDAKLKAAYEKHAGVCMP